MRDRSRALATVVAVCVSSVLATAGYAQQPLQFDIASVKERADVTRARYQVDRRAGRLLASLPARNLVQLAYPEMFDTERIVGGPFWLDRLQFDIEAKFDPKVLELRPSPASGDGPMNIPPAVSEMMGALLRERFNLKTHVEDREVDIFALVRARADGQLGPGLHPSTAECPTQPTFPPKCGVKTVDGKAVGTGATVKDLLIVVSLRGQADRPMRDSTGVDGRFDFTIDSPQGEHSVLSVLPKDFGLKVESRRVKEPVLIIDRMERPTPN